MESGWVFAALLSERGLSSPLNKTTHPKGLPGLVASSFGNPRFSVGRFEGFAKSLPAPVHTQHRSCQERGLSSPLNKTTHPKGWVTGLCRKFVW